MSFDLSKIKSRRVKEILRDAISAADAIEEVGMKWEAVAVRRLVRSRISANSTNSRLTEDLQKAIRGESVK